MHQLLLACWVSILGVIGEKGDWLYDLGADLQLLFMLIMLMLLLSSSSSNVYSKTVLLMPIHRTRVITVCRYFLKDCQFVKKKKKKKLLTKGIIMIYIALCLRFVRMPSRDSLFYDCITQSQYSMILRQVNVYIGNAPISQG